MSDYYWKCFLCFTRVEVKSAAEAKTGWEQHYRIEHYNRPETTRRPRLGK